MKRIFIGSWFFVTLIFLSAEIKSQQNPYDPTRPPDTYRNPDNPYYWKNKMPYPEYWQQDVYYNIKADLDEKINEIDGELSLTYWNNSPDTLHEVFFHLFQNAFQPGSYLDDLQHNNKVKPKYGIYELQGLGTVVEYIKSNGQNLKMELDNTIMRVKLNKPLLPNQSMNFEMKFETYFDTGDVRRRMKVFTSFGNKHYDGVHWYPRLCVYDSKFGWNTDQHLGREFYSDFGSYDVELTFANNYVVEATGVLQNREEVLPDTLRQKLDISNFKDKPLNSKPSVIIPYDSTYRKTWKYHAENVHNFAFTADPTYRIGEAFWTPPGENAQPIQCIALVQEPSAANWQNMAEYTAKIIEVFSRDFGLYGYPKMVVADARDGMEYPMLTLCGGLEPGNHSLIVHEVGHNWFYGMIGNNETYRAALDEGFTQFLTAWGLEALDGKNVKTDPPKNAYKRNLKQPVEVRNNSVYYGYIADAIKGQDMPLNTHSDGFQGALRHGGGYRHVYYKTAVMLYNLQYVLGDSLFLAAMQHYFNQWKFAHPYFEDFRNSFIHYTKADLNWFFDQWLETTKNIDYSVKKVKKTKEENGNYSYDITFKRKGAMQMPIDFQVVTKARDTLDYYIPNTWFEKNTSATKLPKWFGWDKLHPTYTAKVTVQGKIKDVIIDPSFRLADVNMMDNAKKPGAEFKLDTRLSQFPNWKRYRMTFGPDHWWNAYDGVKLGVTFKGAYMNYRHKFSLTIYGNTSLGQGSPERFNYPESQEKDFDPISYQFNYETGIDKIWKNATVFISAKYLDGLEAYKIGFNAPLRGKVDFFFYIKAMNRPRPSKLNYLLYPGEWEAEKMNNSLNVGLARNYNYPKGSGNITFLLRSSSLASDYDYHYATIEKVNHTKFWRLELHSRIYGRYGTGSNLANESALYFAGANNEELMENRIVRSKGMVPEAWVGYGDNVNHFHHGGGLNLRGYAGYLVAEEKNGKIFNAYKGNSGASVNAELDFDGIVKWQPKWIKDVFHFDTYLFGDAGVIFYDAGNEKEFSKIRVDAGAGITMTIKKYGPFETIKPLTIRFDVPFFLTHTPYASPDYFQFRWVVGVNRAF